MAKAYSLATQALKNPEEILNENSDDFLLDFPLTKILKISTGNLSSEQLVEKVEQVASIAMQTLNPKEIIGSKAGELFLELKDSESA